MEEEVAGNTKLGTLLANIILFGEDIYSVSASSPRLVLKLYLSRECGGCHL
jgi:hypothetical protein